MQQEVVRMQIRIPLGLRDMLKELADGNNRSMNGELVEMLKAREKRERARKQRQKK